MIIKDAGDGDVTNNTIITIRIIIQHNEDEDTTTTKASY